MHSRVKDLFCWTGLLFMCSAHSESAEISISSPLVYTVATDSETVNSWSLGIVPGLIGEAYRKSHEKFLAALRSNTNDGAKPKGLLQPFACLGLDPSVGECRRMIEEKDGISDQELTVLLKNESTHSSRVVELKIIFDGRFFQIPTHLYDVRLTEQGDLVRSHELLATYITTYSRKLHEEDIRTGRNDTPFAGKVGSKEAQMHFWLAGSEPRLVTELDNSVRLLAELWSATQSPEAVGVLVGDQSNRASLRRVRDVVKNDVTPCKTLHGDFFVVRDLGEYFWLALPYKNKNLWNNFFIEPRCGFDY